MNHKFIITTFILFFSLIISRGAVKKQHTVTENIKITGKIINTKTQAPIPFVNIGVEGTRVGTITDMDGRFSLSVPEKYRNKYFVISAVGFESQRFSVAKNAGTDMGIIEMKPKNFHIEEVEVQEKSLFPYKVVKTAIDNINDNYIQMPLNYRVYYNFNSRVGIESKKRELIALIYDSQGYTTRDYYQAYNFRNYEFLQARRNFEINCLADGNTNFDDLLSMDIVRTRGNVLDKNHLNSFELSLKEETIFQDDSVYVISYSCSEPSLDKTGDFYATTYKGTLWITKDNFVVLKNETHVKASDYSRFGRSYFADPVLSEWNRQKVDYNFTVTYTPHAGIYYLNEITYHREMISKHKKTGEINVVENDTRLEMLRFETQNPTEIVKRSYHENIAFDKSFWANFGR